MAIVIDKIGYSYFETPVLNDVSITLEGSRVHVLVGPTGSGKTTLALIMAGLLRPQQGTVRVDGIDPASKQFDRSTMQLAFQFPEAQIFEMTVEKEMAYGLKNFGHGPDAIRQMSLWALDRVGLPEKMLTRDPASLSFGERRKVALASVIAIKPRYLILDEPFAGLDWYGRHSLIDTVNALRAEGLTTIILTHETDAVGDLGDTVSIVRDRTVSGGESVTDFLYQDALHDDCLLPDFAKALPLLEDAGHKLPGMPRSVAGVAETILSLFTKPE